PNFRKLVLNAVVWCAHADVPAGGVESPTVTMKLLEANMDPKNKPANFDREKVREKLKLPADESTGAAAPTGPQRGGGLRGLGAGITSRMNLLRDPAVLRELGLDSKQRVAIDNANFGAIGGNEPVREPDRAVANLDVGQ